MTNASEILKQHSATLLQSLQKLEQSGFDKIVSFEIDCEKLATFDNGWESSPESHTIISDLHNNNRNGSPAVYWFEIISEHTAKQIRDGYKAVQETIGLRRIPAINKGYELNSKILYVGKGNLNIAGRMLLHLGYERRYIHLQGIQLCHWDFTGELKNLKLKLNIVYLPNDLLLLAPVFELHLAKSLKPILGKHR